MAAYEISEAMGWGLVPPTVLRDGPYGRGMCQLWIEAEEPGEDEPGLLALVEEEEPGEGWKAVAFAEVGRGRPPCWCTRTTPGCVGSPYWTR